MSPHIGGSTIDAQDDIGHLVLQHLDEFLKENK